MSKLLFTDSDWTHQLIENTWKVIDDLGKNWLGLDYANPQFEIVTAEQMISNYCSNGLPSYYNHWSFGKKYVQQMDEYIKGKSGLAYELVINTDPAIVYLMENNSMSMMALVLAHAAVGHSSVNRMNYLFKQWTTPSFIIEYMNFASRFIKACEQRYGIEEVEYILDRAHSLSMHSIDRYPHNRRFQHDNETFRRWAENDEKVFSAITASIPGFDAYRESLKANLHDPDAESAQSNVNYNVPEENLLYFLEKHSPKLQKWQKEILRIVRTISQYFYPQIEIHLMHEGWASFIHYELMTKMYDLGHLPDDAFFEFLQNHTAVVHQPNVPYGYQYINPYKLGYEMFKDLKRVCENPTEEDEKWFPELVNTDWKSSLREIMVNHKDDTFILQYLSPKVIRDFKFYAFQLEAATSDHGDENKYAILDIHDDDGVIKIRKELSKFYGYNPQRIPPLEITKAYMATDRSLEIMYRGAFNMCLAPIEMTQTLQYVKDLWGYPVDLLGHDEETGRAYRIRRIT